MCKAKIPQESSYLGTGQVNRNPGLATHPGPASKILAGGRCPPDLPIFGWGAKPPQTPPLNGRSSHLIEAAKRGRLDQIIFFSAPLTTHAPPGRPAGRLAERPAGRRLTTRAPPTTVRRPTGPWPPQI